MKKILPAILFAAVVFPLLLQDSGSVSAGSESKPRKIVIVAMPGITWEDVESGRAPNLSTIGEAWSMAAMSIRTVGSRTDEASGFAALGAGNRVRGLGRENRELVPTTTPAGGGGLLVEEMDGVREDNADNLQYGAQPGLLGDELKRAGLSTAVVGNSDGGFVPKDTSVRVPKGLERRRFAGLALADSRGRIDAGSVGDDLVEADDSTANGFRADERAVEEAFREALTKADVVLVELADTLREGMVLYAEILSDGEMPDENHPARVRAVERDDRLLETVSSSIDLRRDTLIVLGTSGIGPSIRERLTVAVWAGVGAEKGGWITSATTKRDGLVTLVDAAPGILRLIGAEVPAAMTGRPFTAIPSETQDRLQRLVATQGAALFHLRWLTPFFASLVLVQAALYLAAWRPAARSGGRVSWALRAATLGFLTVPAATFIWHAFHPERLGLWALPLLIGLCIVGVAVSLAGPWRHRPSGPPATICAITFGILGIDLLTGANLQMSSLVGYSPIVAGRFFGMGNLDFAVFGTSAVLAASAISGYFPKRAVVACAAIGLIAAIMLGSPAIGADFGGLISTVVGFGVLLLLVSGRKPTWKSIAILSIAAVMVALGASFLDYLRPEQARTHLGTFVARLVEDGFAGVSETILRKAGANWSISIRSVISLSLPVAGLFLYSLFQKRRGRLHLALALKPGLRFGLIAGGALNFAGFLVNDSGLALPAMGLAVMVPYCLATILAVTPERDSRLVTDVGDGFA